MGRTVSVHQFLSVLVRTTEAARFPRYEVTEPKTYELRPGETLLERRLWTAEPADRVERRIQSYDHVVAVTVRTTTGRPRRRSTDDNQEPEALTACCGVPMRDDESGRCSRCGEHAE